MLLNNAMFVLFNKLAVF